MDRYPAYPPGHRERVRAEAYGQYVTYTQWAAQSSAFARELRDKGQLVEAGVFQRISRHEYDVARRARFTYDTQTRLIEKETNDAR